MMHKHLSPDEVYPQISSSLRFISPLPCSSYITVYFFIDSLDKCHTSFLNALIFSKDHFIIQISSGKPTTVCFTLSVVCKTTSCVQYKYSQMYALQKRNVTQTLEDTYFSWESYCTQMMIWPLRPLTVTF